VSYVTCAPTLRPTDGGLLAPRWWPVSAFPEVARRQQHRSPGGHHVQPQHRFTNPLGRSRGPGAGAGPALARPARDTPAHPAWSPAGRALFDRDREIEFDALRLVSTVRAVSAQPSDRPLRAETDDSEQRPDTRRGRRHRCADKRASPMAPSSCSLGTRSSGGGLPTTDSRIRLGMQKPWAWPRRALEPRPGQASAEGRMRRSLMGQSATGGPSMSRGAGRWAPYSPGHG
jgi:hypothetical protein